MVPGITNLVTPQQQTSPHAKLIRWASESMATSTTTFYHTLVSGLPWDEAVKAAAAKDMMAIDMAILLDMLSYLPRSLRRDKRYYCAGEPIRRVLWAVNGVVR